MENNNIVDEEFVSLYKELYNENFHELEELRKKEKKKVTILLVVLITSFFSIPIVSVTLGGIGAFMLLAIIIPSMILYKKSESNTGFNGEPKQYNKLYKEKIVGEIIENRFPGSKCLWESGISKSEYSKGGWENFDEFESEDKIIIPLNITNSYGEPLKFEMSEVVTKKYGEDSDGHKTVSTLFSGIAGYVDLPKNIACYVKVVNDEKLKLFGGGKDRIEMDMPEFEKKFDVYTDDDIKTMQILTSDVMDEFLDIVKSFNVRFEFNMINDKMYIRFHTYSMFEANVFEPAMKFETLKEYYCIVKSIIKITENICNKVKSTEL